MESCSTTRTWSHMSAFKVATPEVVSFLPLVNVNLSSIHFPVIIVQTMLLTDPSQLLKLSHVRLSTTGLYVTLSIARSIEAKAMTYGFYAFR